MKLLLKIASVTLASIPLWNAYAAESFTQNGTSYVLYPELKAQYTTRGEASGKMMQASPVFLKTKNFVIVKQQFQSSLGSNMSLYSAQGEVGSESYPVVYNTKTKQYGILRGHFVVTMKTGAQFLNSQFHVVKKYPDFSAYVIDIPQNQSIQTSLDELKQDPNVERVSAEINEVFREPV